MNRRLLLQSSFFLLAAISLAASPAFAGGDAIEMTVLGRYAVNGEMTDQKTGDIRIVEKTEAILKQVSSEKVVLEIQGIGRFYGSLFADENGREVYVTSEDQPMDSDFEIANGGISESGERISALDGDRTKLGRRELVVLIRYVKRGSNDEEVNHTFDLRLLGRKMLRGEKVEELAPMVLPPKAPRYERSRGVVITPDG